MNRPEAQLDDADRALAQRLDAARPSLEPSTASHLRERLGTAVSRRFALLRSTRKRALGYLGIGGALMAIAILGIAGAGPFAA